MDEPWTIIKVLKWTTRYFEQKGIDQPRASAEVLLAHVLNTERIDLYLRYDQPLSQEELDRFRAVVRRRAGREPTQYITGHQEFWSLDLEVTPAVLIPRPETEVLVETALELCGDTPLRVLDLATGSGAIAIALAHERPSWSIIASDLFSEALRVAKKNARAHGVGQNIHFLVMDLFDALNPAEPLFDIIISNLPYVADEELAALDPEIRCYEPARALLGGGEQGLAMIRKAVAVGHAYLRSPGFMILELGLGQASLLQTELAKNPYYTSYRFIEDYSGILRVLCLEKRS